jgi:hypothetical protein
MRIDMSPYPAPQFRFAAGVGSLGNDPAIS